LNGPAVTTVEVGLGARSYPIHIGSDLLDRSDLLGPALAGNDVLVVSDENVAPLYLERFCATLVDRRIETLVLPAGEATKTLARFGEIMDRLTAAGFNRDATLIALGGGVIGDLAGFAAACYQRGIAYVQVPTTLLAQVDSSVGGKTAVNHPRGKNLIGAFHQPRTVLADVGCLETLTDREYRAGLAEVVKYGAGLDAVFFGWLEANAAALAARDPAVLVRTVRRCCELKAEVVAADEREAGRRALLNLGHTFGHAIENAQGYGEWLHGEAVAAGMAMAAELSVAMGRLSAAEAARLRDLIAGLGLPTAPPAVGAERMAALMRLDKKVVAGSLRFVLFDGLGRSEVVADVPRDTLAAVLAAADGADATALSDAGGTGD
jgi:3-dehydroquinate synthase